MRKSTSSKADIEISAEGLLKGAEKNSADIQKFALDATELESQRAQFVSTNALHDELKGKKEQAAKDLKKFRNDLKKTNAKWVSVLEGQYGKDSNKLLDYGIEPRVSHPHKGPRTKKV